MDTTPIEIAPVAAPQPQPPPLPSTRLAFLPLKRLKQDPANVRADYVGIDELANTIRTDGILQPLLVEPDGAGDFVVIAGNRRYLAACMVDPEMSVPVQIRERNTANKVAVQLIENIQRSDLSALETADALKRAMDEMPPGRERAEMLAAKLGKSANWITRHTSFLKLPPKVIAALRRHRLGVKGASAVARVAKEQGESKAIELAAKLRTGEVKIAEASAQPVAPDAETAPVPKLRMYERASEVVTIRAVFATLNEADEASLRAELDSLMAKYGGAQ